MAHRFALGAALVVYGCGSPVEMDATSTVAALEKGREPPSIALPGANFFPEGVARGPDGSLYVGSIGTGAIVRIHPGATTARAFVSPRVGVGHYGLDIDARRGLLWACAYDDALAATQGALLNAYRLRDGALVASYVMPGAGGFCNDVIVDHRGTVYATDSFAGAVVRVAAGTDRILTWSTDPLFRGEPYTITLNGLVLDTAERHLLVLRSDTGELLSIPIEANGAAGAARRIPLTRPLAFPDGLERLTSHELLVMEYSSGAVSRIDLRGDVGTVTGLTSGLANPTTAALTASSAWVVESQLDQAGGAPTLPFRLVRVPLPECAGPALASE